MRLVAIDFETADYGADSACALGIVAIENGRIAGSGYRLIRPPRRRFVFTYIHGINWRDVADAPAFAEVWDDLEPHWRDADYFVAHNAPFDRKVLHACLGAVGRPAPPTPFVCTVRMARAHWSFPRNNLATVCGELGIALNHHHAGSDAEACAAIAVRALGEGFPLHAAVVGNATAARRATAPATA